MKVKKNFEEKLEKGFFIGNGALIYAIFAIIMLILFIFVYPNTLDKPDFLNSSEFEMIEAYIKETENKANMFAGILDSRELSDDAIVALENVIEDLNKSLESMNSLIAIENYAK